MSNSAASLQSNSNVDKSGNDAPPETTLQNESIIEETSGEYDDVIETIFENSYHPRYSLEEEEKNLGLKTCPKSPKTDILYRVGYSRRIDYAKKQMELSQKRELAKTDEIVRDPNNLLTVSISTIILLATGTVDIPPEYYMYTELYLATVKDPFGETPPNITNLIQYIKKVKDTSNITWDDSFRTAEKPCEMETMKPPPKKKISKIPVPKGPSSVLASSSRLSNAVEGIKKPSVSIIVTPASTEPVEKI